MEGHDILHDGRPLVGAKKISDGILIWGPLSADWFFEVLPYGHSQPIFQKFYRLNGTPESNKTYT